ncbi:phosphoribosyltransferase family protein [Sulfurimonas sp.]|jgi:xanthine phosphoribosyltransferase|uniref:phosphoribosyltransferase n=1 Tax=Sulfurimonas sp. TaxID=2022749 RepID=UPI0025D7702C|nr:phosphoribosyltransferase family protein [Sulfurimonas sp.]MCK9472921.1 phosphoribosyltransferase [Sulfurimonas sp.]MDD3506302.1 phosphoribosyltransferase family protein [Sulfurimonas sp.]
MKYYSYEDFKIDTRSLLQRVKGSHFEAIVAVARGGYTLSHAMAEGLDIRNVQSIRTELYDKTIKRDMINIFQTCELGGVKKVLVVDDIADSGATLKAVMEYLEKKYIDIEFVSCTLFYKKTSVYEPHFWINEADDWIDFFWERDFS